MTDAVGKAVDIFDRERGSSWARRKDRHTALEAHVCVGDRPQPGVEELIDGLAGLASDVGVMMACGMRLSLFPRRGRQRHRHGFARVFVRCGRRRSNHSGAWAATCRWGFGTVALSMPKTQVLGAIRSAAPRRCDGGMIATSLNVRPHFPGAAGSACSAVTGLVNCGREDPCKTPVNIRPSRSAGL